MSDVNGITGGLDTTLPIAMTISAFIAIALVNAAELQFRIWMTFRKRVGLYFWSLNVSSWGVIVYTIAFMVKFFQVVKIDVVSVAFITVGWWSMVTGQSLVLYSRLHLIMRDNRRIRWVLYMIVADAFFFHLPTTVLTFGSNSARADMFTTAYNIMEKIQVTAFCIQETIISGLYIWETNKILKPSEHFQKQRVRKVMKHLIWINVLIILMDVSLLCTEYADLYEIQITLKGAVYGFKLRLEFSILNQLMAILRSKGSSHEIADSFSRSGQGVTDIHALSTLHHRSVHDHNTAITSHKPYSVFVGKNQTAEGTIPAADEGVIKTTTEVTIHTSEIGRADQHDDSQTDASGISTIQNTPPQMGSHHSHHLRSMRGRDGGSISSSEIELARAGG